MIDAHIEADGWSYSETAKLWAKCGGLSVWGLSVGD